jgi:hypothetical protein
MRKLIITGALAASLAFGANTAMAAAPQAHKPATALQLTHAQTAHVASFGGWGSAQIAQAPAYGGWQGGRYAGGGSYDYSSPSYDNSATIATGNDAQAASDAENQAIQQMNDTNALTASMAAAEEQNDEANAATLQTEINAGM